MTPSSEPSDASTRAWPAQTVDGRRLTGVEVLRDDAPDRGPREGFLHLQRLVVRNVYDDGTRSQDYPCDIVSRRCVDAVTVVLFEERDQVVHVGLRENLRVPIWLRRTSTKLLFADEPRHDTMVETVAGVLEDGDAASDLQATLRARAAAEAREEVGLDVDEDAIHLLGGASFPSPGITDEKVFFAAARVALDRARPARGDGSTMEDVGGLVVLELGHAIELCREGRIADMKTEIALLRLRDLLARPQ